MSKLTPLQQLQPRSAWQSLDQGLLMVRPCWNALLKLWILPFGLLFALCWWLAPKAHLEYFWIVLWWLKPVYDRILLWIFSRHMQAQTATFTALRSDLRSIFRHGFWASILLPLPMAGARFDLSRSFHLPIIQLEGISPKRQDQRFRQLGLGKRRFARLLTIGWMHAEALLMISLLALVAMLIPEQIQYRSLFEWQQFIENAAVQFPAYFMALLLLEPFYVAAGFSLYLHRRVELEAWDLELQFRHIAKRLSLPLVLLVLSAGLLHTPRAEAQPLDKQQLREQIRAITAQETFAEHKQQLDWHFKSDDPEKPQSTSRDRLNWAWLQALPDLLRSLLLAALILAVVLLLYRYRHWIASQVRHDRHWRVAEKEPQTELAISDDNDAASLAELWHNGQQRRVLQALWQRIRAQQEACKTEQQLLNQETLSPCQREIAVLRQQVQYAHRSAKPDFYSEWQQRCESSEK